MSKELFMTADEVANALGISKSRSYKLIRDLNTELKAKGFMTISGRISRYYFEEKLYGYSRLNKEE